MHLNPESLSFALLISDLGSIARAANLLGMKQATLIRKLTALESRVGVRLFDRSTRGAVPTVSGAGFLNQARRIVADLDTLLTSSRAAASGEEGKLGIGFSTSLAAGGMRALILELIQTLLAFNYLPSNADVKGCLRRSTPALSTFRFSVGIW